MRRRIQTWLNITIFVLSLMGCGGGSSGTGSSSGARTIEGRILTPENQPVEGAVVTLLETGESAITNQLGIFIVEADVEELMVNLLVDALGVEKAVPVTLEEDSATATSVDVKIDPTETNVEVEQLDVTAKIVGFCDSAFENRRIIRQANRLPSGTTCTVKVTIVGDGQLLPHVPFAIQFSGCKEKIWTTITEGATESGPHQGIGQAQFTYFDDREHCVYRIVAPFAVPDLQSVIFPIHTFKKQTFDRESP